MTPNGEGGPFQMVPIWVTPIEEESGRGRLLPPRFNLYKGQQQFWRAWRWWQWWRRKSRTRRWTRRWMRRWTRKWRGTENLFCHLGWIFTRVSRTFGQNNPNQQNSSTRLNVMDRKRTTLENTTQRYKSHDVLRIHRFGVKTTNLARWKCKL